MKLKTLTLVLAATGLAAYPYLKRMRTQASGASTGAGDVTLSGMQAGLTTAPQGRFDESDMDYETPEAGYDESPNTAERLRDDDVVHSPVTAANGSEELFTSSSQRGEEPVAAGLPDLTRGA
jgi:hypothetical protein